MLIIEILVNSRLFHNREARNNQHSGPAQDSADGCEPRDTCVPPSKLRVQSIESDALLLKWGKVNIVPRPWVR